MAEAVIEEIPEDIDVSNSRVTFWYGVGGWFKSLSSNRILIYSFRRILTIIPLFIGISVITFSLMYLIGDPLGYLVQQNPHITEADIARYRDTLGLSNHQCNNISFGFGGLLDSILA